MIYPIKIVFYHGWEPKRPACNAIKCKYGSQVNVATHDYFWKQSRRHSISIIQIALIMLMELEVVGNKSKLVDKIDCLSVSQH